jgi:AcrR family transcriptional regulator
MIELPLIQPQPAERVDAARNRERILCAARRLFAERGAGCVSMDEIAEQAGVGKGTLFRRFGSRAALAQAVLSEDEGALQEGMIRGEPPLGPGAPPLERLIAFGEARLELLDAHAELLVAAELGGAHFASAPYAVARLHIQQQLEALCPGAHVEVLAEMLLTALGAELFIYLRDARGVPPVQIKAGWRLLVERLAAKAALAEL